MLWAPHEVSTRAFALVCVGRLVLTVQDGHKPCYCRLNQGSAGCMEAGPACSVLKKRCSGQQLLLWISSSAYASHRCILRCSGLSRPLVQSPPISAYAAWRWMWPWSTATWGSSCQPAALPTWSLAWPWLPYLPLADPMSLYTYPPPAAMCCTPVMSSR